MSLVNFVFFVAEILLFFNTLFYTLLKNCKTTLLEDYRKGIAKNATTVILHDKSEGRSQLFFYL